MMKSMKAGFTLAEVLTTLMVIGVVAAMTIPTLMNSTQNQQARVAAKKAISVMSQATQLFVAKEEECNIDSASTTKNDELAACFSRVISGTLNANQINTADGMVYTFYASRGGSSLSEICGDNLVTYNGGGNCAVIVDTNGKQKGSGDYKEPDSLSTAGFNKNDVENNGGTDIIALSLSATSARPMAFDGGKNYGYDYIIGGKPASYQTKGCYKKDTEPIPCDGDDEDSSYSQYEELVYTTGACSTTSQKSLGDATKAVPVGACPKKAK